ncbi:MAG: GNAT family N-acetyltransferase [Candidatus Diapherotrites archaeon]|nr:GNAT family N-acetyltransferase [Candidatus Diapherotrites archaeon]
MSTKGLEFIFKPKSIALIGASSTKGTVGYSIMKNLINAEFYGSIYPINNKRDSVLGVPCYKSIKEINKPIDLAIIATPAKTVKEIVKECGEAGVKGLVIVSSGFAEMGEEGIKEEKEIKEIANSYGMRIVGPNCLGIINPRYRLNASFAIDMPKEGNIAFISQSGALCSSIIDWANYNEIGFSYFVSIGTMLDVNFSDLIDFFGEDPHTKSIIIYIESIKDAKDFISAARGFTIAKPIIVLKAGKGESGSKAAKSHTGAMTSEDSIYDAAFQRAGILRVEEIEDLFDCAKSLDMVNLPKGKNLAIITNAGGPGVMAADAVDKYKIKLAQLSEKTIEELNKYLPHYWSRGNPIDVLGDAMQDRYEKAIEACIRDENVDGILVIFTPQAVSDAEATAKVIVETRKKTDKPILANFMGEKSVEKAKEILKQNDIPNYFSSEDAVQTFAYLYSYKRNIELLYETPEDIVPEIEPNKEKLHSIIKECIQNDNYILTEFQSKQFLKEYGIQVVDTIIVKNKSELEKAVKKLKFPLALKINSPDITHKTDAGCVFLNIKDKKELEYAFEKTVENAKKYNPKAKIEGVTIQNFVEHKDYEIIIGSNKDPTFGTTILFGMGGIGTEVFNDKNIGFPPLNQTLAKRLMEKTKIYQIMKKGYRNIKPVKMEELEKVLIRFSYLVSDFPEIKEVDINPIAVSEDKVIALDARIILDKEFIKNKISVGPHLIIEPYPSELQKTVLTKTGERILFRAIRPEDENAWIDLFNNLSDETKRFRFFHPIKTITREMIIRYCHIDYSREIAIAAEIKSEGKKKLIGVARLILDPDKESGEFAVAVDDKWQNKGIGTKLTEYIIQIAKQKGVKRIIVRTLRDNYKMMHMGKKLGFKTISIEDNIAELELITN